MYSLIKDLASTKRSGFVRENLVGLLTTFPSFTSKIVLGFPNSFAFWFIILLRDLIYLESPVLSKNLAWPVAYLSNVCPANVFVSGSVATISFKVAGSLNIIARAIPAGCSIPIFSA